MESTGSGVDDEARTQFDFVSYHSFCEVYGISLRTLVNEYTFGQLTLLSCASHLLAPDLPVDSQDKGDLPAKKLPKPGFKKMASAADAMAYSDFGSGRGGAIK